MKRIFFLVFGVTLFLMIPFSFGKGNYFLAVAALVALALLMIWGSRLEKKCVAEKVADQFKQYQREAQWSGTELIVKSRWLKRLIVTALLFGSFLICLNWIVGFRPDSVEKIFGLAFLILAALSFGYSAWLTLMGFFRETLAGYSLKVDASGLNFACYPPIPWNCVCRAKHSWQENKGIIHHFLDLEFDAEELKKHFSRKSRLFLLGPAGLGMAILRNTGKFQLLGRFLALPVPTIVTAICEVGSRHAPHPVMIWNPDESLEDARLVHELWRKANQPLNELERINALQKSAETFPKPDVSDERKMNAEMDDLLREMKARSDAFEEHSRVRSSVLSKTAKKRSERISTDVKILNWVFGGAFLLGVLYNLIKWFVFNPQ